MKMKKLLLIAISLISMLILSLFIINSTQNVRYVETDCEYVIASTKEVLTKGEKIPQNPCEGDTYTTQEYIYVYENKHRIILDDPNEYEITVNGWVHYVKPEENNKKIYTKVKEKIAGKPVIAVSFAFCEELEEAPKIPRGVIDLTQAFRGCKKLKNAPKIPKNVICMDSTFLNCSNLTYVPNLPKDLKNMSTTFRDCIILKEVPQIPNGVTNMFSTFAYCYELEMIPNIPQNVVNLNLTFNRCESLQRVPNIPKSVVEMYKTFGDCTKLSGNIVIDANPKQYTQCFEGVNFETQGITLSGSSAVLEEIKSTGKM